MSDRSYFSRQLVLSPDSGLGQIPNRVVVNPNSASLDTVRQTLSDFDADIVRMFIRFRSETIASGLGYVKRYYRHPMFEMIYRYNNGQERIDLNMVPVPGGVQPRLPVEDINPDGIISFGIDGGGGDAYVEVGSLIQGSNISTSTGAQLRLPGTYFIYNPDGLPVGGRPSFILFGTEQEARVAAVENGMFWIEGYRVQQCFWWGYLASKNATAEMLTTGSVWGWAEGTDYNAYPQVLQLPIYPNSLFQLTEDQVLARYDANLPINPPAPLIPDGFATYPAGERPGPESILTDYYRVNTQTPVVVNVTVRDGNDNRNITEFEVTTSPAYQVRLIKLGPTALRAKNEFTDPETSRGAEVEIAPPPPKPFSDLPDYYEFEHSDDPTTYTLVPELADKLITELPRDQMPAGGFYKIDISCQMPDNGYITVGFGGEAFAQNILREVTASWTKVADLNETIVTNDLPVSFDAGVYFGDPFSFAVYNYEQASFPPPAQQFQTGPVSASFRLDQVVLPAEDDPEFTLWGYISVPITVTPQ